MIPKRTTQLTLGQTMQRFRLSGHATLVAGEERGTESTRGPLVARNQDQGDDFHRKQATPATPFQKQLFSIQQAHPDLVLFVRVGSFYELYGADADVGVQVGLRLMGRGDLNKVHRAGCRAQSFLFWAGKVISLGRSVGRVEELVGGTGTTKGKQRALLQVYTPGTFGLYSEEFDVLEDGGVRASTAFMALCEDGTTTGLLAGVCVDLMTGGLHVAAWQETEPERSVLQGVVEGWGVQEIVVEGDGSGLSVDTRRAVGRLWRGLDGGREARCGVRYVRGKKAIEDPDDGMEALARKMVAESSIVFGAGGRGVLDSNDTNDPYRELGVAAVVVALRFMRDTRVIVGMAGRMRVLGMDVSSPSSPVASCMALSGSTLRHLEIFEGASLHGFLCSYVSTAMGRRTLTRWLRRPLLDVDEIERRLDVVDALRSRPARVLEEALVRLHDIEKKMPVVAQQLSTLNLEDANECLMTLAAGAADVAAGVAVADADHSRERIVTWGQVKNFACVVHDVLFFAKEYIAWFTTSFAASEDLSPVLHRIHDNAVAAHDVCLPIAGSIPLASASSNDANPLVLPTGVWASIDQRRAAVEACEAELASHGERLVRMVVDTCRGNIAGKTANATLRKIHVAGSDEAVGIRCPPAVEGAMAQGCPQWAPTERSRSALVYKEVRLTELGAELAAAQRVYNLEVNAAMSVLFNLYLDEYGTMLRFCQSIGEVDALMAFAKLGDDAGSFPGGGLTRPRFDRLPTDPSTHSSFSSQRGPRLYLHEAWNPQLLTHAKPADIVLNTISVGGSSPNSAIISGANSGGKTSVLKTAAIATIMAQIGCFVPCNEGRITPVNRILTRLGARDRLSAGESTFAIEMKETSAILAQVDANSLAVIDELGRGTSPKEGLAIVWATLNALASRCRTLLATHYHELNEDFEFDPRVARFHMPIGLGAHRFKLRAGPEPSMSSGGVDCAGYAGVPDGVLHRATSLSNTIKRHLRATRLSPERRLARACLEMLRPKDATSLVALKSLQQKVAFLIGDDDDDDDDDAV